MLTADARHTICDTGDLDATLRAYAPLVARVARQVAAKLPRHVGGDDLTAHGMVGLLDAVQRFDADRGVPFEAFAAVRIRGAILDELRRCDALPRRERARGQRLRQASERLAVRLGREPSDPELCDELGWDLSDLARARRAEEMSRAKALDATFHGTGTATGADMLADPTVGPEERALTADAALRVRAAIERLPERARKVVELCYYSDVTLAEAGRELGVTESRVRQLRMQAEEQLRLRLPAVLAA